MSADDVQSPASDQPDKAPETPEEAVARLGEELATQRAEADRWRDLCLRERAELENYRKRVARDHAEALRYASATLARDFAGILDDLERAVEHAGSSGESSALVDGVRLVLRNALDVLARHGITRIEAAGEAFDPNRHEAIAMVEAPDTEPNRVVQQFLPGYALHDRILRPAQVSVSKKAPVESPPTDD